MYVYKHIYIYIYINLHARNYASAAISKTSFAPGFRGDPLGITLASSCSEPNIMILNQKSQL